MAVKSAKKAIEAAGLPTGTLEEGQEAVQEGQEAPKKEEAGENTPEPEKPQEKPQEGREKPAEGGAAPARGVAEEENIFLGDTGGGGKGLEAGPY